MNVVLGVGGGIAAYKSAELARGLMERGMRVQVVMTDAAREFITPLTFAGLTGHKVITGLFASGSSDETLSSAVEHIAVAQDSEVLVVAPATADLLAQLVQALVDWVVLGVGRAHRTVLSWKTCGRMLRPKPVPPRRLRLGLRNEMRA